MGAEALLAALEACGVDNARIELEGGSEVPIVDGSSLGWCIELQKAGVRPAHEAAAGAAGGSAAGQQANRTAPSPMQVGGSQCRGWVTMLPLMPDSGVLLLRLEANKCAQATGVPGRLSGRSCRAIPFAFFLVLPDIFCRVQCCDDTAHGCPASAGDACLAVEGR